MPGPKTILFMDDEIDQILMIRTRLEASGFRVMTAEDGEAGLRLAQEALPDLILADLIMPKIDGLEVCRRLKQAPATGRIPVVLFTASSAKDLEDLCKACGADACLRKPYETEELLGTIRGLLESKPSGDGA